MKKFKIKNRQKRKYIKKNELAASYSSAQSLTIGLIPLILVGIAFFATVIMTTPNAFVLNLPAIRMSTPVLPQVTLPKAPEMKFTIPEMPKIKTPSLPNISVPKLTLPDFRPQITSLLTNLSYGIATSMRSLSEGFIAFLNYLTTSFSRSYRLFVMTLSRAFSSYITKLVANIRFVGQTTIAASTFLMKTYVSGMIRIGLLLRTFCVFTISALFQLALFIEDISVQFAKIAIVWTKIAISATIQGITALLWFLGTPFRALHAYSVTIGTILAPYGAFLSEALQQAADDLNHGGENLINGTVYVSETVEHNKQKD